MNRNRPNGPRTVRTLVVIFTVLLTFFVAAELLVHTHARFGIDGSFGFHAWFGGVACAVIVALSKLLGIFLKRKDTYFDE